MTVLIKHIVELICYTINVCNSIDKTNGKFQNGGVIREVAEMVLYNNFFSSYDNSFLGNQESEPLLG